MIARILRLLGLRSDPPSQPPPMPGMNAAAGPAVQVSHERVKRASSTTGTGGPASRAAQLMKEAVQLKKEKRYDEACEKLREAISLGGKSLTLQQRLRLPSYLLLAGNGDEAWRCLNELNLEFTEPDAQAAIGAKMAAHLKKEKRFREALVHQCWSYAMEVLSHRRFVEDCIRAADREAVDSATDEFAWLDAGRKPSGKTPSGNPIYDCSFPSFRDGLKERLSKPAITKAVNPLLRKVATEAAQSGFITSFSELLKQPQAPSFSTIRDLVSTLPESTSSA